MEKKGFTIYQVDEAIYYAQDKCSTAWSLPKLNIEHDIPPYNYQKVAVVAAISSVNSDVKFIGKQGGYFNTEDFIGFIKKLQAECKYKKLCLFLDNASIHKT